jgi:large subunit ribosomal protein L9
MEVLLLQDIKGIGQKDDLLIVADGYALNFLLPQSKALIATPTVRRRYAEKIRRRAVEREKVRMADQQKAVDISKMTLTFMRKASDAQKLYAAVTEKNIVEALHEQHSIDVAESAIVIRQAIKTLGEHSVEVVLPSSRALLVVLVQEEK